MDLDNNSTLQAVLKQRRMIQDSLRQAMTIQKGGGGGGGKGVPGAICFAWGAGSNGQLGQPVINGQLRSVNTPTVVKFEKLEHSIVRVASGNGHVACVTDSGECYGWGDGRSGQLVRDANEPQRARRRAFCFRPARRLAPRAAPANQFEVGIAQLTTRLSFLSCRVTSWSVATISRPPWLSTRSSRPRKAASRPLPVVSRTLSRSMLRATWYVHTQSPPHVVQRGGGSERLLVFPARLGCG